MGRVNVSETLGVTVVGLPCGYAPDLFLILLNIAVMSPSLLVVVYDFAFYFCRAAGVSKILEETRLHWLGTQCYRQWLLIAPLCIKLKIKI